MELPTYEECARKAVHDPNGLTPLEEFIYMNEPAGLEKVSFRRSLKAVISTAHAAGFAEAREVEMMVVHCGESGDKVKVDRVRYLQPKEQS
jgi:hypothetical protein